jgi:hypothetical protein
MIIPNKFLAWAGLFFEIAVRALVLKCSGLNLKRIWKIGLEDEGKTKN